MSKFLADSYNTAGNLLVISSYPERKTKYSGKVCAVGGFTKNILEYSSHSKQKNIILTVTVGKKQETYLENGNLIHRVFKRNSLLSYFHLIKAMSRFPLVKNVMIQFEFSSFGNTFVTLFFPLVLLFAKLNNKHVVMTIHQIVDDLNEINGHLGWKKNGLKNRVFNTLLKLFYVTMVTLSNQIVVLEDEFKNRLAKITGEYNKISVIPHGVDTGLPIIPKSEARKKLHLPQRANIYMYFGYLTWYKGADLFLEAARQDKDPSALYLMAGGVSFTQKKKFHYRSFASQFKKVPKNVILTGFLDEKDIPLYYGAADLIVLPYRTMISSSGPLSLAFSMEKPVIMSHALLPYLYSDDFKRNMKEAKVTTFDLFHDISNISSFKCSESTLEKLSNFSKLMKQSRSYSRIHKQYYQLINSGLKSTMVKYHYRYA